MSFSQKTVDGGKVICENICEWYLNEEVSFIPTEFKSNRSEHQPSAVLKGLLN
jgi:hypothetical protein